MPLEAIQPLCRTKRPLHTRQVVEQNSGGDILQVYCLACPVDEPILIITDRLR